MEYIDVILLELGKFLCQVNLSAAMFLEYKSCINFPKLDDYFHWYFLIFLVKNLIVYAGIRRFKSVDNKWFAASAFTFATIMYSHVKPSMSEVGYSFNTWSFAFIYLLLIYVVASRVTWNEFFGVLAVTIFVFFAEEKMTGFQFAVDCFFAFFSLRFTATKLFSKLTGLPYALFFLFTFYVENYCFNVWGLGMLSNGIFLSMIFVYMTRKHGNSFFNIFPIALCSAIIFTYIHHFGITCLPRSIYVAPRPRPTVAPRPKDAEKMAAAMKRAMDRLTATGQPILKMDLPPPIAD